MKIATTILAGAAFLTLVGPVALAQQAQTGILTQIDRINHTVTIKPAQSGTIGANTGAAADEFKAADGLSLEGLHAGDKVSFSVTEAAGSKTVTKLEKQ